MLLRSRTLTPAALAARRANALKSTGSRTQQGKARVALNSLKHGRSAVNLPEKLARAGHHQGEAEWRRIRARIARAFQRTSAARSPKGSSAGLQPGRSREAEARREATFNRNLGSTASMPSFEKKIDRLANCVWCAHRGWQEHSGAKLKSASDSVESASRLTNPSQIWARPKVRIHNPWARVGLVFYTQCRRGQGLWLAGLVRPRPEPEMESALRARVYRLPRPRFWERIRYCLDHEGNYHPEWQGRFRECRRELRNSPMAMWLEPHPILADLRQQAGRGTGVPPPEDVHSHDDGHFERQGGALEGRLARIAVRIASVYLAISISCCLNFDVGGGWSGGILARTIHALNRSRKRARMPALHPPLRRNSSSDQVDQVEG